MLRSFEKNGCRPTLVRCFCIQLAALGDISLMFSVLCRNISEGAHYSIMAAAITIIDIAAELIVDQRGGTAPYFVPVHTKNSPTENSQSVETFKYNTSLPGPPLGSVLYRWEVWKKYWWVVIVRPSRNPKAKEEWRLLTFSLRRYLLFMVIIVVLCAHWVQISFTVHAVA